VKTVHVNQTGGDNLLTSTKLSIYPDGLVQISLSVEKQPIGKSLPGAEQLTGGRTGFARQTIPAEFVSPS
jgi:hypothetical protein